MLRHRLVAHREPFVIQLTTPYHEPLFVTKPQPGFRSIDWGLTQQMGFLLSMVAQGCQLQPSLGCILGIGGFPAV